MATTPRSPAPPLSRGTRPPSKTTTTDTRKGDQKVDPRKTPSKKPPTRIKGVTAKQLLTMGRRFWGRNSQWVKLARPKRTGDANTSPAMSVISYSTHDNWGIRKKQSETNRYVTTVASLDDPGVQLSKSRALKVSCQCKSHKYGCEYKLHKLGAADLVHSNGRAPQTYMVDIPAVCKHVYKTLLEIVRRGV